MRRISLNARRAIADQNSAEVEVVLVIIEHPDIPDGGKLRLSADDADEISLEPHTRGTYSTWRSPERAPFYFIIMDALYPDEKDTGPASATLILEILDSEIAEILTSTTVPATCHMAVVLASSPDYVEGEYIGLQMTDATVDAGQAALRFSMELLYQERYPAHRMTKQRMPGMHR